MTPPATPDEPTNDAWDGERAARWLRQADGLQRQLGPVSDVLLSAAALVPGERVLDVGCGTGPITRQAAAAVGAGGAVTGVDISADLLAAAAGVEVGAGAAPITWTNADVVTWDGPEAAFDVVISRFGVMFFSDPTTAFATLASTARPGGRMAVAVWARRDRSPMFEVPLRAALDVLDGRGLPAPSGIPADGGPFSLGDADAVRTLLTDAGWSDVTVTPHRLDLSFGGGLPPDDAAAAATDFGPTRIALDAMDDAGRADAVAAIADAFAAHTDANGHVVLAAEPIVVTARR